MTAFTDNTIIEKLQSDNRTSQNEAFKYLYKREFTAVKSYVLRYGGTATDAEDVFQDSLVVLYTKLRKGDFVLSASLHTFLQSICRNLWKKKLRDRKPTEDLDNIDQTPFDPSHLDELLASEKTKVLASYISRLGADCRKLLTLYYFERVRIKKITELLKISSDAVTKNRKSRCMKNLRQMTADDKSLKELLSS